MDIRVHHPRLAGGARQRDDCGHFRLGRRAEVRPFIMPGGEEMPKRGVDYRAGQFFISKLDLHKRKPISGPKQLELGHLLTK